MAAFKGFDLSPYRVTAVVLTVLGVCYGCCIPKGFFGPVRVLHTTVAPSMPDTSVKILMTAYDAEHKRMGISYPDENNLYTRNILDFGKGIEFIVTGDWYYPTPNAKCTKYPLKMTWPEKGVCVPENATRSEGFYMGHPPGQYYREMDAVAFTYTQGSVNAKVMVTQDKCALVGEVVYDTSNPAGTKVINRLYVNQSMDANTDFFKLNPNVTCVPDPNPPAVSPWQRIGMFGWLLGLPEN